MKYFYRSLIISLIILILCIDLISAPLPIIIGFILRTIVTRVFVSRFAIIRLSPLLLGKLSKNSQSISGLFSKTTQNRWVERITSRTAQNPLIKEEVRKSFVKPIITKNNAAFYEGIGGQYKTLRQFVSKKGILEADHFPAKSLYQHSSKFRDLTIGRQPAISLTKNLHKQTLSYGSSIEAQLFRQTQAEFIKNNQWKNALEMSIKDYQKLAGHDLNAGIRHALNVHQRIGTITRTEFRELVKNYHLKTSTKRGYISINNELMSSFPAAKQSGVWNKILKNDIETKIHLEFRKIIGENAIKFPMKNGYVPPGG